MLLYGRVKLHTKVLMIWYKSAKSAKPWTESFFKYLVRVNYQEGVDYIYLKLHLAQVEPKTE